MNGFLIVAPLMLGQSPWYDANEQAHLKKFWPASVEMPAGARFYDMPQAYQHNGYAHSPDYNIAANPDPFGNANREFPWGFPAGTHRAKGWSSYKWAVFPGPIQWWYERKDESAYNWAYPDGTQFGEMLLVKDTTGHDRAFEVRIAEKRGGIWSRTPFRPIASEEDLPENAKKVSVPLAAYRETDRRNGRIMNVGSVRAAFGVSDFSVDLWDVGAQDPKVWLAKPFKQSRIMYTANVPGSIVPQGYLGNVTNCAKCHDQVGQSVDTIDARAGGRRREWYGSVRGADKVYSFHIFAFSSISRNGFNLPVQLNKTLNLKRK